RRRQCLAARPRRATGHLRLSTRTATESDRPRSARVPRPCPRNGPLRRDRSLLAAAGRGASPLAAAAGPVELVVRSAARRLRSVLYPADALADAAPPPAAQAGTGGVWLDGCRSVPAGHSDLVRAAPALPSAGRHPSRGSPAQ